MEDPLTSEVKPPMYRHPPVAEVVCEFRFVPSTPWDWTVPGLLYEKIRETFPIKRQQPTVSFEVQLQGQQDLNQRVAAGTARMQFLNADETAMVQVGPDLLAINAVKSYPGWGNFKPMILSQLGAYVPIAQPKEFQRIGLRYINRIDVPSASEFELDQYFQVFPRAPDALGPKQYTRFIQQVEMPYKDGTMRMIIGSVDNQSDDIASTVVASHVQVDQPDRIDDLHRSG